MAHQASYVTGVTLLMPQKIPLAYKTTTSSTAGPSNYLAEMADLRIDHVRD